MNLFGILKDYGDKIKKEGRQAANRWLHNKASENAHMYGMANADAWSPDLCKAIRESYSDAGHPVNAEGHILVVTITKAYLG